MTKLTKIFTKNAAPGENKFEVKAEKYSVIENASLKTKGGSGPLIENRYFGGHRYRFD